MTKIRIDGKYYEVKAERNLLETCLAIGLDIPHFCFHPALGSVGACRLCAVKKFKDQDDRKGKIVMSCMEPVTEGLIVSIEDPEARAFRAAVIESLMTNHPHDCPVCDEGGECHLQDMTVMTGHNYRQFDFRKRTYNNQDLGPFIAHEMNRCIQCYRCVRFYRDYAGGKDLNVFSAHNNVYFGRHEDGTLVNEFSGNLVEVCPTGVFTDKTLKNHFTRKWDLTNSPSVCVHCSVGCNTIASERYGSLRRIMNRYNGAVNGYFICDRGRFGYGFVNDDNRIRTAKIRVEKNGETEDAKEETLVRHLEEAFSGNKKIIGIGSPRASLESNYTLSELVGKENFYHGISKKEYLLTKKVTDFLQKSNIRTPSLKQIEKADAVLVLGEDLTNTAPMIALALRQAIRNKADKDAQKRGIPLWNDAPVRELAQDTKSPVFIATPFKDSLDEISDTAFRGSYSDIANLGYAIASSINDKAPVSKIKIKEQQELAEKIALTLKDAANPLIISGITSGDENILHSAINIANALSSSFLKVMISFVLPECNSMGLAFLPGKPLDDAVLYADNEEIDTLVILENDLYRRTDEESVVHLFDRCSQIVVLDHLQNKTSIRADIVLPAATFAESQGTLVNNEGRAQRYYKAMVNKDQVRESWRWISEILNIRKRKKVVPEEQFDNIVTSLVKELPVFSGLKEYMPGADFRMLNTKIPRQTMRFSGRTAVDSQIAVSESKPPQDPDSPMAFTMEGQQEQPPSSLIPFYWTPGWNSVQATFSYLDEPNGMMKGGDPGVRLIEPENGPGYPYFKVPDQKPDQEKGEWQIIPVYHIFGSDELSSFSYPLTQRIQKPYMFINQKDGEISGIRDGDLVQLDMAGISLNINVKFEESLKQGIAGLSVKLPGQQFFGLPGYGKFTKI